MLNSEVLISEALVIALPPKHRLASKPRVSLSALENEPFILVPRDSVPVFHDAVLKACRSAGFVPHVPHEADQLQLLIGMVAAGAGVALVPAAARRIRQYRLVYRPVHPSPDNLDTAIAWRKDDASPILAEFVSAARRVLVDQRPGVANETSQDTSHARKCRCGSSDLSAAAILEGP